MCSSGTYGVGVGVVRWWWLARRSAAMVATRLWVRVRVRRGIFAALSTCPLGRTGTVTGAVGAHSPGKINALPGWVTYFSPAGEVQMIVPSRSCSSRHPQNVLAR